MNSLWLTALRHPLNRAMLPISIAAGLLAAWWLLPVGLAIWVIMIIIVARDESSHNRD